MEVTPPYAHEPARRLCAICCAPRDTEPRHLTHGIVVHLCAVHRALDYLRRDGGRVFVRRLTELWAAHNLLTGRRREALTGHLRRVRDTLRTGELPGSYAWRAQREEAERRLAAGEPLNTVIRDLRHQRDWGATTPPSVRTIRRWYAEARWLTPPAPRAPRLRAAGRIAGKQILDALDILPITLNTTYSMQERPRSGRRRPR